MKIYSHDGTEYVEVWMSPSSENLDNPLVGASAVGDADNDGYMEVISPVQGRIYVWESDVPNATTFTTSEFDGTAIGHSVRIGNIR
jgi:hypothetical protein